ncbi:hypothetical protein SK128_012254 [Halocaridina rubra]|uniref:DUF4758 domain-containing protein n=1 Tax=Halocaridina rubra TaxID=373956 RepID=A0AAN8WI46_HALRR
MGLLSSTVGTFINDGTTSEYVTLIHGKIQSGQYTQLTSTSSRVFFALPVQDSTKTSTLGLVSSEIHTRISNRATTLLSTNYVRTHIDGTYAELIETFVDIHSPIPSSPTAAFHIQGTFTETSGGQSAKLEVSLLDGSLNPTNSGNEVVTLTGTQGQFIKAGPATATTYNVFTGSYVRDHRSYLFFFGNTVLPDAFEDKRIVHATQSLPKEVVLKRGGDQSKIFVDMEDNLHVIMPSKPHDIDSTAPPDMLMGEGVINGHHLGGVFIEGSEGFEMEGVQTQSGETSMLTITVGRPVAHKIVQASSVADPVEVTVLSMKEKIQGTSDSDNEIDASTPRARKASLTGQEILADLKPSNTRKVDLPTFTINQVNKPFEEVVPVIKNVETSVETSVSEKPQELKEGRGRSLDDIRARFNLDSPGEDSDLPTVTYVGFADFTTTIADTVVVFTPHSGSAKKALKPDISKTIHPSKTISPVFSTAGVSFLAPRLVGSGDSADYIVSGTESRHPALQEFETKMISKTEGTSVRTAGDHEIVQDKTDNAYSTISTHRFNSVDLYPTGLVSSIGGTIVMDDMTTLLTTYVYGTYIKGQYAQIVQSTSSIFYLVSRTTNAGIQTSSPDESPITTINPDGNEITTEFYNTDYYEDSVLKDITDNSIGRSVASSPDQQKIVDTNEKNDQPLDITTPLSREDYSISTLTSHLTYFRDGQTTVSTRFITSTVFNPFFGAQDSAVNLASGEKRSSLISTYVTTYTYYTTLFADGITRVSTNLQVSTKTIGASDISLDAPLIPTKSVPATETSENSDFGDSNYDYYDFTSDSLIESYTESLSESTSESSTDSFGQDVTEKPNFSLDSSLNHEKEVNAVFFPRTYYTTFTYFTTYYKSETSTIVSSLETITNVVSDARDHDHHKSLTPVVPTYPVTYYTTYTYWTTFYKGNETISTSTEKTLSNIVTPSAKTTPIAVLMPLSTVQPSLNASSSEPSAPAATTFYTTYTYYTSTYVGDSVIVNSRLETATRVVSATPSLEAVHATTAQKSTGLLSTIRGSTVIDATTTIFSTNIIGTIIDGLYAQIRSSTSQVIQPSTPFFLFPATTKESSESTPFFIYPATAEPGSSDLTPNTQIEDESSIKPLLLVTPTLDSSLSDSSTDLFDLTTATEALPEEVTTEQPEDESLPHAPSRSKSPVSIFPSKSHIRPFSSRSRRPDIIDFLRRSSSKNRSSATITRDGITPTVTATPASGSEDAGSSSSNKSFRFGNLGSSHTTSPRFRFNPSSESSRPGSTSGFGLASSSTKILAGLSSSGGFRLKSASPSIFPGSRKNIAPSSVLPQVIATEAPESELVEDKEPQNFNNPEASFRPFSFRQRTSSNGAGTRSSVPFALLNRRPSLPATSRAPSAISQFTEAVNKKREDISVTERQPQTTSVAPPKLKNDRINRLSAEERRQNRFRQSRPDLSKLFRRRNPLNKDLNNEASALEPVFVEADGRILSSEEVEAILAAEVYPEEPLERKKRQVSFEFGARTTSRGTTRFNRQNADTTPDATRVPSRGSRQARRQVDATPARNNANSQFTLSNSRRGSTNPSETNDDTASQRTSSRSSLPFRQHSSGTRSGVPLGTIKGRGFRRPSTDNNIRTSSRFTPTRPASSPIRRPRPSSTTRNANNNRRPSSTRNNQQSNPIANFRNRPSPDIPTEPPVIFPSHDGGFLIQDDLTVTREVPVKATIPLVENSKTIQKEVITASYQTEIIQPDQITQTEIDGQIKLLLSTVDGGSEITQYIIEPKETTFVTSVKTFIGGRRTSIEHTLPTTAYNLVTVTKSKGGDLQQLLQLLLGQQQQQNPLLAALGLGQQVSSTVVHTKSYVTTVTNLLSTVIPVIFRGKTIETTVVDSDVKVVTATELSTETILTHASISPFNNAGALNQLLPLLLQGQLQQQSPQIRPTREPSVDMKTVDPQLLGQMLKQHQQQHSKQDVPQELPESRKVPQKPNPTPPAIETSVVTLYVSGRRPGDFSTLLSTVTLSDDSTRIKRGSLHTKNVQATVLPHYIKTDKGLFQLPETYDEDDMDWYIMSAMNEIDTNEISKVTPSLDSVMGVKVQYYDKRVPVYQNGTHSFNTQPFLWVGPAEFAPLKRNRRSAQRGNGNEFTRTSVKPLSARKIQDGTPQQIISNERERSVVGHFNVPGQSLQNRLISEQIQQLQPPTTYYTTFTYYTTLVDEIGQEFVQSSEETITQIATNGNIRFDDFTRTGGGAPLITEVPVQIHEKFTLEDAIIPGKPRPVPDPVFPEPPPPFGPVIRHFDDAQPFHPVPQPFVPKEFREKPDDLLTGRKVPQHTSQLSPQLIIQPNREDSGLLAREEEQLALSQKPRRVVLTRKRPIQVPRESQHSGDINNKATKQLQTGNAQDTNVNPEPQNIERDRVQDILRDKSLQQSGDIQKLGSSPTKDKNAEDGAGDDSVSGANQHIRIPFDDRIPVKQTTSDKTPTGATLNSGGRRRVVVTRRLPQPTVVASRLQPLVATVNTYFTVYSYLYTHYKNATLFSVSTREVTVSNQIEPTVVSVLPKFQTGTPVQGFYTIEMGGTTATLGERVIDSLTTQIFLASATLVELSPEAIRQNVENQKQHVEERPKTVGRPSPRRPTPPPSLLQSSQAEADQVASTDTPFLTTSSFRATQSRGQFGQPIQSRELSSSIPDTTTESFRGGIRNRGRGTVRFEDSRKRTRFTVTRRRPVETATREPNLAVDSLSNRVPLESLPSRTPVRTRGHITHTDVTTDRTTSDQDKTESLRAEEKPGLTRPRDRPVFDIPIDAFRRREKPAMPSPPFSQQRFQSNHKESQSHSLDDEVTELPTEEEVTEQVPTESPSSEASLPTPTPTRPTRPPRTSIRRDDIPIIRRPGSDRPGRPFLEQEDSSIPSHLNLRFTPAPEETTQPTGKLSDSLNDTISSGADNYYEDEYYEDYYYYEDYADTLPIDGTSEDTAVPKDIAGILGTLPTPFKSGPRLVRPTTLSITSSSFDIIEALKRERTFTQIVTPSRLKDPGSHRRTRTESESFTEAPLPSNVVYSTYATTTLLPILGGKQSITLTILTSTLVTLAEEQVHLITASPQLFNPALVTSSLSVPSLLLPSQAATATTFTLPDGEVVTSAIEQSQASSAIGSFSGFGIGEGKNLEPQVLSLKKFISQLILTQPNMNNRIYLWSNINTA